MSVDDKDLNLDPITKEPGAHPVGTGVGAGGGAMAGAAAGALGGPIGMAVGAVVGAVVGGLAGKSVAEAINPTAEEAFWRDAYTREEYARKDYAYDDYAPAYRAGWESRAASDRPWDEVRTDWERRWGSEVSGSRLTWPEAEPAVRAAWERANRSYVQSNQG